MYIVCVIGREILDSRGNPTVEADVILDDGTIGRASVPAGASTGSHEAYELRDQNPARYLGKGVLQAIYNINNVIHKALKGQELGQQANIDALLCDLDGTANKSHLGANALLAVSLATARAHALSIKVPLFQLLQQLTQADAIMPIPLMNVINGGMHADNPIDIKELMIMPLGAVSFAQALQMGAEVFHALKAVLKKHAFSTTVGDEGGFAPALHTTHQALDILCEAIHQSGYRLGDEIALALDIAASELFHNDHYELISEQQSLSAVQLIDYYKTLITQYPIISIEDALDESDWPGWQILTQQLGKKMQLVGDDIFVTNAAILQNGIDNHIANAILIKPNQIFPFT